MCAGVCISAAVLLDFSQEGSELLGCAAVEAREAAKETSPAASGAASARRELSVQR